jgi:hypothetical protein
MKQSLHNIVLPPRTRVKGHFSSQICVNLSKSSGCLVNLLVHSWFTGSGHLRYNPLKTGVIATLVHLGSLVHKVHTRYFTQGPWFTRCTSIVHNKPVNWL